MRHELTRAVLLAFAVGLCAAIGCAENNVTVANSPPPVPTPSPMTAPTSLPAPNRSTADAATRKTAPSLSLDPLPVRQAPVPEPYVEIKFPIAEQLIPLPKARDYKLRLKAENWPVSKTHGSVQLSLDDFPGKNLYDLGTELRLSELVPEDKELTPGEHLLVAILAYENGETLKPHGKSSRAPFAAVHFWIGQRGTPTLKNDSPVLIYGLPRGTYNGVAASENVLFDCYLLGQSLAPGRHEISVAIRGQSDEVTTRISALRPLLIRGLSSGDYTVELSLYGPNGRLEGPYTRASRVITVNRDAVTDK